MVQFHPSFRTCSELVNAGLRSLVGAATCLGIIATAQNPALGYADSNKVETGRFDRRSITIVPTFYNNSGSQRATLVDAIAKSATESRYDITNVAPETASQASTSIGSNAKTIVTDSLLIGAIKSTNLVRDIIRNASNMDSLRARLSRQKRSKEVSAASDQKISGPTKAQTDVLLNGTYIVVVAVDSIVAAKTTKYHSTVAVVRLNVDGATYVNEGGQSYPDPAAVKLTVVDRTTIKADELDLGASFASLTKAVGNIGDANATKPTQQSVHERATKNLVEEVYNYLATLSDFKVRAMFQDYSNGIDAGVREGLYTDMAFKVYETEIDADGKASSVYKGYGRIERIGDNASDYKNLSTVYAKIGSYDQGMIAVAEEQGLQISLTPNFRTLTVPKEVPSIIGGGTSWESDATSAFGLQLGVMYNLAKHLNVSQLFVGLKAGAAWINAPASVADGAVWKVSPPFVLDVNLNVTKKFDMGRLAFVTGLDVGFSSVSFLALGIGTSGSVDYNGVTANVSLGANYCAGLNLGLEYQATSSLLVSLVAGYRLQFMNSEKLTVKYSERFVDQEYNKADNELAWLAYRLSDVNLGGITAGLQFTYILPRLF